MSKDTKRTGCKRCKESFYAGVVTSLDVVAFHNEGLIFKEIINNAGRGIKSQVKINGLKRTRRMLREEFYDR
jgi:hypothetical protein